MVKIRGISTHERPPELPTASGEQALVVGLLRTLSVFRVATLVWAAIGFALSTKELTHTAAGYALLGLMILTTGALTAWPRRKPLLDPLRARTVIFELLIGIVVLVGDGLVYGPGRPQSLPWSWPAAGVMAAGIIFGTRAGFIAAATTGAASLFSEIVLLGRDSEFVGGFSKLGLWILAGSLAGYIAARLRHAEEQISVARAREEVARQLHDGVLQTLAVIQRRSTDSELAALARDQEHDLRGFLAGSADEDVSLEAAMRRVASRHERLYTDCKVHVVVATDLPAIDADRVGALSGAIGEALTNASKHGAANKITIYAEPADDLSMPSARTTNNEVFVSIKDDGDGFDIGTASERIGISRSIKGRIQDSGGDVEIMSTPGRGTEVQLWV